MARLYEATGCKNIRELAELLGVRPAQISDARRRLRLPVSWLRTVFLKTSAHPAWLKDGIGERHL